MNGLKKNKNKILRYSALHAVYKSKEMTYGGLGEIVWDDHWCLFNAAGIRASSALGWNDRNE